MTPSGGTFFRRSGVYLKECKAVTMAVFLTLFVTGCTGNALEFLADDDSKEATLEEALMALDDEDFDEAAVILEKMDGNDPKIKRYLSNAYSGQAGLDTFSLIETIEEINESDSEGSIDLVGKILDDDKNGTFSEADIVDKASKFDKAIETMLGIGSGVAAGTSVRMANAFTFSLDTLNKTLDDPDLENDILVQLGLLGLNHAVLSIAKIVLNDLETEGITEITLTEEWIKSQYKNHDHFSIEQTEEQASLLEEISIDLNLLSAAVAALLDVVGGQDGNDLEEAFDDFLQELDANGDLVLMASELENYLGNL